MAQYDKSIDTDIEDIGRHSIWFSNHTKFKNCEIKSWKQKGIVYINDLLGDNGNIMSFEEIKNVYKVNLTVLDYLAFVQSLPIEWRRKQRTGKGMNPIIHPNIQNIISHKLGNKYIYNILIRKKYRNVKNTWESRWEQEIDQIEWAEVYKLNTKFISTAYQTLQYKILTKIIATNRLLHQIGIVQSYKCDRCTESIDTIIHKFWSCPLVKSFWDEVGSHLRNIGLIQNISVLNKATVTLGYLEAPIINHVIVVGKRMIANKSFLSMDILFNMLKRDMQTERFIANKRGKISDHDNKWGKIAVAISPG